MHDVRNTVDTRMPRSRISHNFTKFRKPGSRKRSYFYTSNNQPSKKLKSSQTDEQEDFQCADFPQLITRLPSNTTNLVHTDKRSTVIPFKLRPYQQQLKKKEEKTKRQKETFDTHEYGIVKFSKISDLFNNFIVQHTKTGCMKPVIEIFKKSHLGICISAYIQCKYCMFKSTPVDLFDRSNTDSNHGYPSGSLNDALGLACLKTKMGMTDIQFLLSLLSIKPPSITMLQRKVNKISDVMIKINEESMVENQKIVKEINALKSSNSSSISVETDVSYNNRPRLGYEAGTQAFSPMIENITTKKLTLSLDYVNKLCSHKVKNCTKANCRKNYPDQKTVASSEGYMLQHNLEKIENTGIVSVDTVTSDACNQINKVCKFNRKPVRHLTCFLHKMRTFQKHIHFMKLETSSNKFGLESSQYIKQLALAFRKRIQKELGRIKRRCKQESEFVKFSSICIKNIINCFTNNHSMCGTLSTVCQAYKESFRPTFLPCGKYLNLCQTDINKITAHLSKDFSHANLHELYGLTNTNKSESMHNRLMTYITKRVTWSRNFGAMCHSAVHSDTHGTGHSTLIIAKEIGIFYCEDSPFYDHMINIDTRNIFHKERQKSELYRQERYFRKLHQVNRKLLENSMYNMPSVSTELYNFAIKPK